MTSDALQKARAFEAQYGPHIPAGERPAFHLTPTIGWMNDPNGFSIYRGEYHLFYQYHPYSNEWGPMHWGHVKSGDLIRWERLPAALAPDCGYDAAGCFSGGAVEMPDGRQHGGFPGPQGLAGGRWDVLRRHWQPRRRWQRGYPALQQRGRPEVGVRPHAGCLPQPIRKNVGVPGFLPAGRRCT